MKEDPLLFLLLLLIIIWKLHKFLTLIILGYPSIEHIFLFWFCANVANDASIALLYGIATSNS